MSGRYDNLLENITRDSAPAASGLQNSLVDTMRSIVLSVAREAIKSGKALKQYESALNVNINTLSLQNDAKWAIRLERGGPSIDMRSYMLRGMASRNIPMDRSTGSTFKLAETRAADPWTGMSIKAFLQTKLESMSFVRDEQGGMRLKPGGDGPSRAPAGMVSKLKPEHVADPFNRMVKMSSDYAQKSEVTGFRIWRRMSEKGAGQTWMQPPQPALRILQKSVKHATWQKTLDEYRVELKKLVIDAFKKEFTNG